MTTIAVIKTGGKQYLVKENDQIIVDAIAAEEGKTISLTTLARITDDAVELGTPELTTQTKAKVIKSLKGDKVRVSRFKAKARYHKVKGFRPRLTKIEITTI